MSLASIRLFTAEDQHSPLAPARFNPNAKVDPRVLRSMLGQMPKPRRASFRIG